MGYRGGVGRAAHVAGIVCWLALQTSGLAHAAPQREAGDQWMAVQAVMGVGIDIGTVMAPVLGATGITALRQAGALGVTPDSFLAYQSHPAFMLTTIQIFLHRLVPKQDATSIYAAEAVISQLDLLDFSALTAVQVNTVMLRLLNSPLATDMLWQPDRHLRVKAQTALVTCAAGSATCNRSGPLSNDGHYTLEQTIGLFLEFDHAVGDSGMVELHLVAQAKCPNYGICLLIFNTDPIAHSAGFTLGEGRTFVPSYSNKRRPCNVTRTYKVVVGRTSVGTFRMTISRGHNEPQSACFGPPT